jgi:hypothetical protein
VRKSKPFEKDLEVDATERHNEEQSSSVNEEDGEMIVSFQDEFGGYCSRLRIDGNKKKNGADAGDKPVQDVEMQEEDGGANIDVNLCKLLNIDVDKIALKIAMGEDPWSPDNKENMIDQKTSHTSLRKSKTSGSKSRDSCLNKTDMKHSTANSLSRESQYRSQSDLKLPSNSNKTVDGLLEVPNSESDPRAHVRNTHSQPLLKQNQSPSSEMDLINEKNKFILQEMMEPIDEFDINNLKLNKCKQ